VHDDAATRLARQERNPIHEPNTGPPEEIAAQYLRDTPPGRRGINLGCGGMTFKDWLNIDVSYPWHCDILCDLTQGMPFLPDGQFDAVYSEAFLEHVSRPAATLILQHSLRALRSGGHIRIAVPDLRYLARTYLSEEKHPEAFESIREEYGEVSETDCELFNYAMGGVGHTWIYDRAEIDWLFAKAGFVDIRACEIGKSSVPFLHNRENRPYPDCSLITEGTKPG
jgi:predicted SAM-dependent methyltransferase